MADRPDDEGRWLPLEDAAAELGLPSGEALRGRIRRRRDRYRVQLTNDNRLLVYVAPDTPRPTVRATATGGDRAGDRATADGWLVALLLAENARLAALLSAADDRLADQRATADARLADAAKAAAVRAEAAEREVARLEAHVTDLRAELARRRWPGLLPLLRRLWAGE